MRYPPLANWSEYLERHREIEKRITDNAKETLTGNIKGKYVELPKVTVQFEDEFAPGEFEIGIDDPNHLTQASRSILYCSNWGDIGNAAIAWVADRNYPYLLWPDLGTYTTVDDAAYEKWVAKLGSDIETQVEGSEEWLCYLIYFRLLELSYAYTEGAPQFIVFESTHRLGGLVRELELSHNNKQDALIRKKSGRAFLRETRRGRDSLNAERKINAAEWHSHASNILAKLDAKGSKSAIAGHILAKWDQDCEFPPPKKPARKTIQNWLSSK